MDDTAAQARAAGHFRIAGDIGRITPLGSGHIHDTFLVETNDLNYVLQKVNRKVFTKPVELMENLRRVTDHLQGHGARTLTIVQTLENEDFFLDDARCYWRCFLHVSGTRSHDRSRDQGLLRSAARSFAEFVGCLRDLPEPPLHETIPAFGDTAARFDTLERMIETGLSKRISKAGTEIDFCLSHRDTAILLPQLLADEIVPERIIHFDTKLNNVLCGSLTKQAVCVIDLDTVMSGSVLYDFGDLVRSAACLCDEDEPDATRAGLDMKAFDNLARGYMDGCKSWISETESRFMAEAPRLVAFVMAVRFLSDYLAGDVYYKTSRPQHNLQRCRTQLKLVQDMKQQTDGMRDIIRRYG